MIVAGMTMAMLLPAYSEAIPPLRRALEWPFGARYWSTSLVCTLRIRAEPELRCAMPAVPVGVPSSKLKEPFLRSWQRRLNSMPNLPIDGDLGFTSPRQIARQSRPFLGPGCYFASIAPSKVYNLIFKLGKCMLLRMS